MKTNLYKWRLVLAICIALLAMTSCIFRDKENFGYPEKVSFSKKGGVKTIKGERSFISMEIREYNGKGEANGLWGDEPSESVTYDWLTVTYIKGSNTVEMTAEPMTGKKSRKLYVELFGGADYAEIVVKQKK